MKLELQGIKKSFDGTEILHGINFSVEGGSALGLLEEMVRARPQRSGSSWMFSMRMRAGLIRWRTLCLSAGAGRIPAG